MKEYFKFRDPFGKNLHRSEIGNSIKFERKKEIIFFFKKFFSFEFEEYYPFHLGLFPIITRILKRNFFAHVLDKIAYYNKKVQRH